MLDQRLRGAGRRSVGLLCILTTLVCVPPAQAKGKPDKIIVRSGKLGRPVEITDRNTLKGFDPWGGQFIDWNKGAIAEPAQKTFALEVYFYMKWPERHSRYDQGDLKLIYALRYYPGRNGEPGYVYLPASGEAFYDINVGTISDAPRVGKWYYASPAWDAVMRQVMRSAQKQQTS
ncbi:MAG TPA: hypothetical protein VKA60_00990 [Blastocatellia bacterium]|nr:hypothetical protein [Blastocatellia bacterium]